MFYIKTRSIRKREVLLLQFLPTIIVILAFAGITIISWSTAKNNVRQEQQKTLELKSSEIETTVMQRLRSYEDLLRGAAGLFNASEQVTAQEWATYFASYELISRHPSNPVIGYSKVFSPSDQESVRKEIEERESRSISIFPESRGNSLSAVTFIEPLNTLNRQILGYNMYTDDARKAAMDKATETGSAAVSDLLTLRDPENKPTATSGFIIVMPVYRTGSAPKTIDERKQALTGFVYMPFRPSELLSSLNNQDASFGFVLSQASRINNSQEVYTTDNIKLLSESKTAVEYTRNFSYADLSQWTIKTIATDEVVNTTLRTRPSSVLWGGVLFCCLVGGFVYMLLVNRSRALADREEQGIQSAKDELIALASHQLRTPATGVKQYIGMLKQGFAGELTEMQTSLVEKAYLSNERQLGTINEMLVVARADAGHLKSGRDVVDICELLSQITNEFQSTFLARQQQYSLQTPKSPVYALGSRHYLQMAFENIVNNASKYTKTNGKIDVILSSTARDLILYVKDTGVGVARKDRHMLFKKFSRIPNELTNRVVGSGIGLYLVKKILDAHNGSIRFESKQGQGSLVTITLPRHRLANSKEGRDQQ